MDGGIPYLLSQALAKPPSPSHQSRDVFAHICVSELGVTSRRHGEPLRKPNNA